MTVESVLQVVRTVPLEEIESRLMPLSKAELLELAKLVHVTVSQRESKRMLAYRIRVAEMSRRTFIGILDGATP